MNAAAPGHTLRIPPLWDRITTAASALATLSRDPSRLDQVLVLGQAMNVKRLARALERMTLDPEGARLLAERPRIDAAHVDWDALERLPDGTLGREYVRFLRDNGITPDAFEKLPDVGDERAAYIMLRIRQTHDLWHVLTGYKPDIRGELLLQAFTFAQTKSPSAFIISVFGSARFSVRFPREVLSHGRGLVRAWRRGTRTKFLPTFAWEDHWSTPVADLRDTLACAPL
jgi:ubiquinone biosynthesis protein COQ4